LQEGIPSPLANIFPPAGGKEDDMGADSFWGESDDAREENISIYENSQMGLDADGCPFEDYEEDDYYEEEDDY
jgi:hypothetical protein